MIRRHALWLAAATLLVYANSLSNGFTGDDYLVVANNRFIQSPRNLPRLFSKSYLTTDADLAYQSLRDIGSGESSYRPVVTFSYFADRWIWGRGTFGYHLTNLLLHLANVLLFYALAAAIAGDPRKAFLAALLFALHPLNSEAVNAIAYREDLLAFLFVMASFIAYRRSWLARSAVFFLLALFSKESAVVLPALLILHDYCFVFAGDLKKLLGAFRRYLVHGAVLLVYVLVWLYFTQHLSNMVVPPPIAALPYALTLLKVFGIYVRWLVFPIGVHLTAPDPAFFVRSFFDPAVVSTLAVLALLAAGVFQIAKRRSMLLLFSALWFLIAYLPVSGLVPTRHLLAARYLTIPIAGFCLVLASLVIDLRSKKARAYVIGTLVAFYAVFTFIRNITFSNNLVFFSEMAEHAPNNAMARAALAECDLKAGRFRAAVNESQRAIALDARLQYAHYVLGVCYYKMGRFDKAAAELRTAVDLDPRFPDPYLWLVNALGNSARYEQADPVYKRYLEIDPSSVTGWINWGINQARRERWQSARALWVKALASEPGNREALLNLKKLRAIGHA